MSRRNKVLIGLLAVIAVAIPLIALLYPRQGTKDAVAVLGCLIGLGKIAYDIIDKERERKNKAEQARERLRVSPRYGMWESTGMELGVVIYNEGATTVHIESVECRYRATGEATEHVQALVNMDYSPTQMVEPRHVIKYRDGDFQNEFHAKVRECEPANVCIVVRSYQGEIARVDGAEIIKVLTSPPTSQLDM